MNKALIVFILIAIVIIVVVIVLKKKYDPLDKFMKGKVFLDQNNAHGDVLGQFDNISPDDCIDKCKENNDCAGLTWSDKGSNTSVCYLNKAGDYLQNGNDNDYAWTK